MEDTRKNIERIQKISDALTERDLEPARKILATILVNYPNGFTILSHVDKIPRNCNSNDYVYEYQLSQPVAEFMLLVRERYPDKDLASAICGKILGELTSQIK